MGSKVNQKARGTIEMTSAMVLLGTIGLVVVETDLPITGLVFWRCLFGALALFVVCAVMGLFRGALTRDVLLLSAAGGVAIVTNWLFLFGSFPKASISVATAVYSTQPFMLVLLGVLFLSERLTLDKLLWLGVAFGGILLVVGSRPDAGYVGTDHVAGVLMAAAAAFFYALAALLTKKLAGTPPPIVVLIQVCVGIVMLAPFIGGSDLPADASTWFSVAALGVVYTGLLFTLQYGGIQKLPTHLAGSLYFVYPVVAILVDALVLGHRLQLTQIVGAAAILLAAAGMNLGWRMSRRPTAGCPG